MTVPNRDLCEEIASLMKRECFGVVFNVLKFDCVFKMCLMNDFKVLTAS